MRPQTCSATSLDTHRRALSRRPGAFFLATWTFLRHDSWAATYVYLHSTTATTATARSAEENFGASRAAAGVDAVVSQLGRGGAPLRFPAVGGKSLSRQLKSADLYRLRASTPPRLASHVRCGDLPRAPWPPARLLEDRDRGRTLPTAARERSVVNLTSTTLSARASAPPLGRTRAHLCLCGVDALSTRSSDTQASH